MLGLHVHRVGPMIFACVNLENDIEEFVMFSELFVWAFIALLDCV